jgi:hypothetical protein
VRPQGIGTYGIFGRNGEHESARGEMSMSSKPAAFCLEAMQYKTLGAAAGVAYEETVGQTGQCKRIVRTHLASFAKRRERAYYGHRAFTTCAVSSLGKVKSSTSALTRSF